MTTQIIPTSSDPAYRQTTALSGRDYLLDFDYNARDGMHTLSISRDDGERLLSGLALLPGRLLLRGWRSEDRPPGDLLVVAARDVPELGDFGTDDTLLLYLTDEDLEQFTSLLAG